jgi:hypothetical protein
MLKKLITVTIAATAALSLSGCAGLAQDAITKNASYEAGVLIGKATTQDTLDVLSDGTIETFCGAIAEETEKVSTEADFSVDEFTKGCVEGFNEAN